MRFLHLILMAAVITPLAIAAITPVNAAKACKCSVLSRSGCIEWNSCNDVPGSDFRRVRSTKDCRGSQLLVCDGTTCKLACYSGDK